MKANNRHSELAVINKVLLKLRVFTMEIKAEVLHHKKAENLSLPKFDD
jgi:hypothetical protein